MYDNFLNNEKEYLALEEYWINHFTTLLKEANENPNDWLYPYYNTTYSNGTKFMDGNPIFSAKSLKTEKTLKIIQEAFDGEEVLEHWHDPEMQEYTIVCVLAENNQATIDNLLKEWIANNDKSSLLHV